MPEVCSAVLTIVRMSSAQTTTYRTARGRRFVRFDPGHLNRALPLSNYYHQNFFFPVGAYVQVSGLASARQRTDSSTAECLVPLL